MYLNSCLFYCWNTLSHGNNAIYLLTYWWLFHLFPVFYCFKWNCHVHVHICWDMFSFLRVNILLYLMKMCIQLEKKQINIISVRKLRKMSLFLKITTMIIFSEKFKVTFVTIYVILQELFELRNLLEKNFQLINLKGPHSLVM